MNLTFKEINRILQWSTTWDMEIGLSLEDKKIIEKLEKANKLPTEPVKKNKKKNELK